MIINFVQQLSHTMETVGAVHVVSGAPAISFSISSADISFWHKGHSRGSKVSLLKSQNQLNSLTTNDAFRRQNGRQDFFVKFVIKFL